MLLRVARQVAGLSLHDLAKLSGLSKGYLSKLESAHPSAANPSRATLAALAPSLPATLPLFQQLDPADTLPPLASLIQEQPRKPAINPGEGQETAAPLPATWTDWEILLAVSILERSGFGPPTEGVLARACGVETLSSESLSRLEQAGLLQRLPASRPGEVIRYTRPSRRFEQPGLQRPAEFFLRAAISLLLRTETSAHEPPTSSHTTINSHHQTLR